MPSAPTATDADRFVLGSEPGLVLEVLTLGATTDRLHVTGGDGRRRNVLLGLPSPEARLASTTYLGATIGRYANRIAGGRFPLEGDTVEVPVNDRGNALHGGPGGFDRRVWDVVGSGTDHLVLELVSPDGDMGFPGRLTATASFAVGADSVRIEYAATTDRTTVVNMTNHAYFNLDGDGAGTIDDHLLTVDAELFTPVDATGIPLGEHAAVDGTPFDFRHGGRVGDAVRAQHPQIADARGVDHDFVIDGRGLRRTARLVSRRSRTALELWSDQPGLQVYTGNFLDGSEVGTAGRWYRQGDGIALEPQLHPDSPNRPAWPSAVLRPGETYRSRIEWRFEVVDDE